MIDVRPQNPKWVIAIVGTTATGKTELGISLAKQLDTEIISADSQLIYRELDIGTAKPLPQERSEIPHHMVDICAPNDVFSAAQYQRQGMAHLNRLWERGKIPLVVGGTGFYLKALLESDFIPDVPPNPTFRNSLSVHTSPELHARLTSQDPNRASALHPNDRVRILRALEIIEATGQTVPQNNVPKDLSVLWLGLQYADRQLLDQRIDDRIDRMLEQGWLNEVESLLGQYGPEAHALGVALGYPELAQVVQGKLTLPEATEQIRISTRQYARRQMTWFKRNPSVNWIFCDQPSIKERLRAVDQLTTSWLKARRGNGQDAR